MAVSDHNITVATVGTLTFGQTARTAGHALLKAGLGCTTAKRTQGVYYKSQKIITNEMFLGAQITF